MRTLTSDIISKCANWLVLNIWIFPSKLSPSSLIFSSTYQCFDQYMQRSKKTLDYVFPAELCVMVNVVFCSKSRASKLISVGSGGAAGGGVDFHCSQSKLDDTLEVLLGDMSTIIKEKLLSILELTLSRLARYDEVIGCEV